MKKKRTTVLINPKQGDGGVEKWVLYRLLDKELPSEWCNCGIIDLVVDPEHFSNDETPTASPTLGSRGHIFIPVSPDDRHLGGSRIDASVLVHLVLGPWSLKELKVAFPYMIFENPKHVYDNNQELYEDTIKNMEEYYYFLGGLPRYLIKTKGDDRKEEVTPDKASQHSRALLDALVEGKDFSDKSTEKILTRFFTLRAGEDEKGYNPTRRYTTLDFVSPGAIKAAGKIILEKIRKDFIWRGLDDASDIGLAFERVVLMFLAKGTAGMGSLGIQTRCRQLLKRSQNSNDNATESLPVKALPLVRFVLNGSIDNKIEEAPNNVAF
jgi:hypothetical protein